jgi:hypothetical protein
MIGATVLVFHGGTDTGALCTPIKIDGGAERVQLNLRILLSMFNNISGTATRKGCHLRGLVFGTHSVPDRADSTTTPPP